ncbi:DUF1385 domain-containing protein [Calidifontibacillus erzurumensis]|uniref:DUF1385 domain-containing protein n=1 Tax=Calidifontibacillus erzurumensis TaxID=2741433 RepID=A0A8J8GEF7_9BACI|nr:DUF1385 domain-containing protein [Calidifontibacillus erzurumensis]NSL50371.1 DUF1385 domain-containing protein [Calidifontibacillus erzurumensis]
MTDTKKEIYGGQAVIEGVMFGGKHSFVTAIRRKDQSIEYFIVKREKRPLFDKLRKIPFIRGIVAILEASANGSKHLNFSSERYDVDPKDDEIVQKEKKESKLTLIFGVAAVGIISFLFGKFIFTLTPAFLAELLRPIFPGHVMQNLIEGFIKFILLLSYIYFVSLTPLVKRVFQYHGAEHKVINAYEKGKALTIENVQAESRLHYRCGSSFILFTVIVGVFVYMLVPTEPLWLRVVNRLALLPVVLGVSFEVLQLTNKLRNVPILRYLGYPGLWLQLLTTKEPTDDQVEVSIASFKRMLEYDKQIAESKVAERIV